MKTINVVNGPQNVSAIVQGCMRMAPLSVDEAASDPFPPRLVSIVPGRGEIPAVTVITASDVHDRLMGVGFFASNLSRTGASAARITRSKKQSVP